MITKSDELCKNKTGRIAKHKRLNGLQGQIPPPPHNCFIFALPIIHSVSIDINCVATVES